MTLCIERPDRAEHCCWIQGQVCEFLTSDYLCGKWDSLGDPEWQSAPVGRFFAALYPGYDCSDWPQNIPDVSGGLCCWEGVL